MTSITSRESSSGCYQELRYNSHFIIFILFVFKFVIMYVLFIYFSDQAIMTQSFLYKIIILFVILHNEERSLAFKVLLTSSITHQEIMQKAILQTTIEVCKAQALQQGRDFVLMGEDRGHYFVVVMKLVN